MNRLAERIKPEPSRAGFIPGSQLEGKVEHISPGSTMFFGPVTSAEIMDMIERHEPRSTIKPFFENQAARLCLVEIDCLSGDRGYGDMIENFNRHGFSVVDRMTGNAVRLPMQRTEKKEVSHE